MLLKNRLLTNVVANSCTKAPSRTIINKMESKGLIIKDHVSIGKRAITAYKPTQKGIDFCKSILEPYEIMFPRTEIAAKGNIPVLLVLV